MLNIEFTGKSYRNQVDIEQVLQAVTTYAEAERINVGEVWSKSLQETEDWLAETPYSDIWGKLELVAYEKAFQGWIEWPDNMALVWEA